jgi:hypothetical protein
VLPGVHLTLPFWAAACLLSMIPRCVHLSPEILLQHNIDPPVNEFITKLKDEGASVLTEIRREHGRHHIHHMSPFVTATSEVVAIDEEQVDRSCHSFATKPPTNDEVTETSC